MAETSVPGAIRRRSSGDCLNRTEGNRPTPPLQGSISPSDLISALPDALIHHTFSFLPLQDVVRTSVLSKRWRSTWTTITDLVFDGEIEDWPRSTLGFSSLVDSVLSQCASPTVKRFHVTGFKYDVADRTKVDLWLSFAAERRVVDLRLWVSHFLPSPFFYILPSFLYCLSWLVRLEVSMCCFSLGVNIRWPCLKFLSIDYAELSDDILGQIFRGSPVLESLELCRCWGVKNIIIESASVKELILDSPSPSPGASPGFSITEKIWAPHLLSLRILGSWDHFSVFSLDDISSLVEAELGFFIPTGVSGYTRMCCDLSMELLEKLRGVSTITIGGWCLQTLSVLEMEGVPSPLSKWQNLILHGSVGKWDLPGIAYMLRSSPCLEKLVIHSTDLPLLKLELDEESRERFNFDEENFLCSRKENFKCLAKHLKRVEIIGFKANSLRSTYLFTLIKFLLGDALVLEKLIIKAELPARHGSKHLQAIDLSKLHDVSKNVLGFQRASRNAEVIFNHSFEKMREVIFIHPV